MLMEVSTYAVFNGFPVAAAFCRASELDGPAALAALQRRPHLWDETDPGAALLEDSARFAGLAQGPPRRAEVCRKETGVAERDTTRCAQMAAQLVDDQRPLETLEGALPDPHPPAPAIRGARWRASR